MDADMQEKQRTRKDDKQRKEENIINKILRLLSEEQFISLEEEIRGKELLRKETGK